MTSKMLGKTCPFCGIENNCMVHKELPCWCNKLDVPKELLELVPEELKRKACICFACIQKFKVNRDGFTYNLASHEEKIR